MTLNLGLWNLQTRDRGKKNRHRLEIVKDMLFAASEKTKKTRIMYQANLSYRLMEKYLESLLESDLVRCDENSFFYITWKGKEFLQMYEEYLDRCRRIGDEIHGVRKEKLFLENICFNNRDNQWLKDVRVQDK